MKKTPQHRGKPPVNKISDNLSQETINNFFDLQKQNALNDASRIRLEEKHIENQKGVAYRQLDIQEKLLLKSPSETRKTLILFGIFGIIGLMFLGTLIYFCLTTNHEAFLEKLLGGLGILALNIASFIFGRKSNDNNNKDNISPLVEDAEIID